MRAPVLCLIATLALFPGPAARGDGTGSPTPPAFPGPTVSLHPLTALAGGKSNGAVWEPLLHFALKRFFPADVTSDYLGPPLPVSFILPEVISLPTIATAVSHQLRFVILQGCRPHECLPSRGVFVVDIDTGDVCAVLYRMSPRSSPWTRPDPLPEKPTTVIDAEIFVPAPADRSNALIDTCAEHFSLATQRLVPDGFWIEQGETRVRAAPAFQVDPELAARFPVWNGLPRPY